MTMRSERLEFLLQAATSYAIAPFFELELLFAGRPLR